MKLLRRTKKLFLIIKACCVRVQYACLFTLRMRSVKSIVKHLFPWLWLPADIHRQHMRIPSLSQSLCIVSLSYMHSNVEILWIAEFLVCIAHVMSDLMATVCGPKLPPFPVISIRECQDAEKMFRKSNVRWLWHASLQQLLQYFATFSPEMLLVEEEGREAGCSASQQPLLCRIHAVKLWLFRREKQKATAPVLNIVSFLSVSFSFYHLPLLLCLIVLLLLLLCCYSAHSHPLYLPIDKRLAVWGEGGERYAAHSRSALF